ncbi:B-cell receptor CD22-like isoform X2 [Boleophthalmus pectinirostris]|uniref:B-cell receptor CD22-like isoform X2 n=1 Tax=Boleophthalmus pectinirostris TaxID=150288 RepID=UPI00242BB28C|nr:B-cell receptor CD22-like isoform X2 [Boleophthalmus pectinirostris]
MMPQQISCLVLLMMVKAVTCYSVSYAEIETTSLNALVGTCVEIRCKVTGVLPDEDALWFWMKDGKRNGSKIGYTGTIVYSNKPRELPISPQFRGRVTYTGSTRLQNTASSSNNPSCSVRICDLTEQDRGVYFFRYSLKKRNFKWTTNNAVISVTDPCPITFNKPEPVQESQTITLTCSTPSSCSENLEIQTVPPSGLRTSQYGYSYSATASYRASWTDDGKEFTCQTRGNKNPQLMKKISISVEYSPHGTQAVMSSTSVKEGHSVTLTCSAKGNPAPVFTWYKNNQRRSSSHSGAIWKIDSAQTEHSGEYVCTAQNKHGTERSNSVHIDVQYAPVVEVRVSSPQPPYKQDQTLTLSCTVIRSNPHPHRYNWYKNDQRVSWGQTYVKTLQPEDSGSYTCSAENTVSSAKSGPLQIDVEYKPKNINIEIVGQSREVAVGHSVTLKCNSDANPPPHTYYWYKGSQYLQRTTENRLELKKVQRADEGCYICKAANKHGSGYSTDLCIQVLYSPTSLTLSMDSEVTEGQNVSITCRVDSSPVSTLTLSRTSQGSPVELLRDTEHNSLIYSVTVTSAHSGEYTCSAHNSVGSDSTKRSLTVKYAPQKVRVQADPGLMVKENTTLTLHCSALSHPPVSSVTWSRGPTGQEPLVHTGPTFSVSSVSVNDSGLYSCTAHNQVGQGTSPPAEVQVMFGPKQAVVLRAEEEQGPDGSSSVTLSCNSHSFPPVNLYTWYRRTEDGELKVSENINYTVLSTQPGVYYCTAKNQISESTSEPVSLFLQENFVKYIGLALVPLLIIVCAFIVYRFKMKRNDTSSANALYSTVTPPEDKRDRPGISDENTDSLYYVSLHFDENPSTLIHKKREDVIYSTVKTHDEEAEDVYENVTKNADGSPAADSSEDEVDVSYSEVNFRSKVRSQVTAEEEEEYSELNF